MRKAILWRVAFGVLSVFSGPLYAQVVVGGGGGGLMKVSEGRGGLIRFLFPNEDLRKPCREGAQRFFWEQNPVSGRNTEVLRVCRNGRYFQKSNIDYSKLRCYEGTRSVSYEQDPRSDHGIMKMYRCINGKRVQTHPPVNH